MQLNMEDSFLSALTPAIRSIRFTGNQMSANSQKTEVVVHEGVKDGQEEKELTEPGDVERVVSPPTERRSFMYDGSGRKLVRSVNLEALSEFASVEAIPTENTAHIDILRHGIIVSWSWHHSKGAALMAKILRRAKDAGFKFALIDKVSLLQGEETTLIDYLYFFEYYRTIPVFADLSDLENVEQMLNRPWPRLELILALRHNPMARLRHLGIEMPQHALDISHALLNAGILGMDEILRLTNCPKWSLIDSVLFFGNPVDTQECANTILSHLVEDLVLKRGIYDAKSVIRNLSIFRDLGYVFPERIGQISPEMNLHDVILLLFPAKFRLFTVSLSEFVGALGRDGFMCELLFNRLCISAKENDCRVCLERLYSGYFKVSRDKLNVIRNMELHLDDEQVFLRGAVVLAECGLKVESEEFQWLTNIADPLVLNALVRFKTNATIQKHFSQFLLCPCTAYFDRFERVVTIVANEFTMCSQMDVKKAIQTYLWGIEVLLCSCDSPSTPFSKLRTLDEIELLVSKVDPILIPAMIRLYHSKELQLLVSDYLKSSLPFMSKEKKIAVPFSEREMRISQLYRTRIHFICSCVASELRLRVENGPYLSWAMNLVVTLLTKDHDVSNEELEFLVREFDPLVASAFTRFMTKFFEKDFEMYFKKLVLWKNPDSMPEHAVRIKQQNDLYLLRYQQLGKAIARHMETNAQNLEVLQWGITKSLDFMLNTPSSDNYIYHNDSMKHEKCADVLPELIENEIINAMVHTLSVKDPVYDNEILESGNFSLDDAKWDLTFMSDHQRRGSVRSESDDDDSGISSTNTPLVSIVQKKVTRLDLINLIALYCVEICKIRLADNFKIGNEQSLKIEKFMERVAKVLIGTIRETQTYSTQYLGCILLSRLGEFKPFEEALMQHGLETELFRIINNFKAKAESGLVEQACQIALQYPFEAWVNLLETQLEAALGVVKGHVASKVEMEWSIRVLKIVVPDSYCSAFLMAKDVHNMVWNAVKPLTSHSDSQLICSCCEVIKLFAKAGFHSDQYAKTICDVLAKSLDFPSAGSSMEKTEWAGRVAEQLTDEKLFAQFATKTHLAANAFRILENPANVSRPILMNMAGSVCRNIARYDSEMLIVKKAYTRAIKEAENLNITLDVIKSCTCALMWVCTGDSAGQISSIFSCTNKEGRMMLRRAIDAAESLLTRKVSESQSASKLKAVEGPTIKLQGLHSLTEAVPMTPRMIRREFTAPQSEGANKPRVRLPW